MIQPKENVLNLVCGIFGYAAKESGDAFKVIHKGLRRLEYRGYDSWGISVLDSGIIKTYKTTNDLAKTPTITIPKAKIGIGHTRWATHGNVTKNNAHPHYSSDKTFVLAQNGIVENFSELKLFLQKKGFVFTTQTDTEVIVRLIEHFQKNTIKFEDAVTKAFKKLAGRNTIIVLTSKNTVMAIKNGSPLVVGLRSDDVFISSDILSFLNHTDTAIVLNDMEMVLFDGKQLKFTDLNAKKVIHKQPEKLNLKNQNIDKEGFDHFMLKEITEQPNALMTATSYTFQGLEPALEIIKNSKKVFTIGAGTASYAAGQVAYYLRSLASVNTTPLKAYEVSDYKNIFDKDSVLIVFSQSGETADTLEALKLAKENGVKIISLVNMVGSTISRKSDLEYYLRVGPEICVVSTKAFLGMLAWGYLLTKSLKGEFDQAKVSIRSASENIDRMLSDGFHAKIQYLAKKLVSKERMFVLGRGQNYNIAKEGALKIKETSYKHAEAFSAGELKHGVIALIEKGVPVICLVSEDDQKSKILNAASEVKARGGYIIEIGQDTHKNFDHFIKTQDLGDLDAFSNIIPFQLLAYYMSTLQDYNPDKPRNLAKSVTVS